MNRFTKQPGRLTGVKYLISIGIFCIVLFLFLEGLSSISTTTSRQEMESLERSVVRSTVQCYALDSTSYNRTLQTFHLLPGCCR